MVDAAFVGAGKKAGRETWRIEHLAPVRLAENHGKFYTGDSYIILVTTQSKSGGLTWAIHFWLGEETSLDEAGCAAFKTVELDESLGGGPVQYREVQGNESQLFLSYYKNSGGIEYIPGGIESGFRKVERDVWPTRLLHCKGKRTVRVKEVPLSTASLNNGDVFILDTGLKIYIWNGPSANKFEKAKGLEVATNINNDERGGRGEIIIVNEDPHNADFWTPLGGFKNITNEGEDDDAVSAAATRKLFQITDASGAVEFSEIAAPGGKLNKNMLNGDDVFLLHSVHNKIFLWIGKKSTLNEKKEATARAVTYIHNAGLPKNTAVERVTEGSESAAFKSEFTVWEPPKSFNMSTPKTITPETPPDVAALISRKATEDAPVDDGSGKLQIWVINDFKKVEVDPAQYGEFFGGDSYILLYTYLKNRSEEYIIYFWLGNDSTPDEKGAAALLAVQLDDSLGGKPVQVRVTQGKEPAHFRQLFKGKTIIYKGGNSSGFSKAAPAPEQADNALFHIRGTNALNTVAVQVNTEAASLNSEDSFVLVTSDSVYAWQGHNANADELTVATNVATILAGKYKGKGGRLVSTVKEGSESEDFWSALGGKTEYSSTSPGEAAPKDPRLFSASTATGSFKVEEIDQFDQSDLNDEDVFLLDTFTQLFVWIGSQSSQTEKDKAMEFAHRYNEEANDGRDADVPVIKVHAGQEPSMFSAHFLGWDAEYTKKRVFVDPYQAKLDALNAAKASKAPAAATPAKAPAASVTPVKATAAPAPSTSPTPTGGKGNVFPVPPQVTTNTAAPVRSFAAPAPAAAPTAAVNLPPITEVHSYESLKNGVPAGVDPARKEEYLDDKTFKEIFEMDKKSFAAQPKWKKDDAKKKKGLF